MTYKSTTLIGMFYPDEWDWVKKFRENLYLFEERIEKIKKTKDYRTYSITYGESVIIPWSTEMRHDIWLSDTEKIWINYYNEEKVFRIVINCKNDAILYAFEILHIYMEEWRYLDGKFDNKMMVLLNGKTFPIITWDDLDTCVKKEIREETEEFREKLYKRISASVWIEMDEAIRMIDEVKGNFEFEIVIEKIEDNGQIDFLSCFHFKYESKYYPEGYLSQLEWDRINKLTDKWGIRKSGLAKNK